MSDKTFENDDEMKAAISKLSHAIFLSSLRGYTDCKRLAIALLLGLINTNDLYKLMYNKYALPAVASIIHVEGESFDKMLSRIKAREEYIGNETFKYYTVKDVRVW